MRELTVAPFLLAALIGLFLGAKYLRTPTFMPYQQRALGKTWDELDPGVQTILMAMLRAVGGGFLSLGVAMVWAALAVYARLPWAPWAALSIAFAGLAPAISATLLLRRFRSSSRPPTGLAFSALTLIVVGVVLAL